MTIGIMQPYFFPYLGYYQLLNKVDKFVIYDDVNFINRGWINRNNILVNHKATLFSIPLVKASQNRLINEITLSKDPKWKHKFLKTIKLAYKKAPYFESVYLLIETIINSPAVLITDLIVDSLEKVMAYLQMDTILQKTSVIYENAALKGQHRILDICMQENATTYINPIGGKDLYEQSLFEKKGIELFFIETTEHQYSQFKEPFIPYLSMIDVLMFNSVEEINLLLDKFKLTQHEG